MSMKNRSVGGSIAKVSLGAIHDFKLADHLLFGVGGLFALNFVPNTLEPLYSGNNRSA